MAATTAMPTVSGSSGSAARAHAPTVTVTPVGDRAWGDPMRTKIPLGRFAIPLEVASVVTFLASDLAAMINGETILIDGGLTAH